MPGGDKTRTTPPAAIVEVRRPRRWPLVLMLPVAAVLVVATAKLAYRSGRQATFTHTGPTVTELEKLGHLCTLRVHVADVLQVTDEHWYGDIQGAWIVKGDALVAVNLAEAKIVEKDPAARTAVMVLPPPALLSPRVDHERTRTYDYRVGLLRSPRLAHRLRDQAMLEAQRLVEFAAQDETRHADGVARRQAEDIIRNFYELVGWSVQVRWADAPEADRP